MGGIIIGMLAAGILVGFLAKEKKAETRVGDYATYAIGFRGN